VAKGYDDNPLIVAELALKRCWYGRADVVLSYGLAEARRF
jgi:hypothetical protein